MNTEELLLHRNMCSRTQELLWHSKNKVDDHRIGKMSTFFSYPLIRFFLVSWEGETRQQ